MGGACGSLNSQKQVLPDQEKRGKCRLWTGVNNRDFIYPELQECPAILEKQNIGIALSGGGMRALSHSIGTLRGLHLLGLWSKIRYISSNSGSSWLNGPLSYSQNEPSTLLGEYLPPERCSCENLKRAEGCHASKIPNRETLNTALRKFRDRLLDTNDEDPRSFWSELIGEVFFKPYHLDNFDHLPAVSGVNQKDIVERTGFPRDKINLYDLHRSPFPIINGCIVVQGDRFGSPVEFTPLYYGVPGKSTFKRTGNKYPVGGYLIEPFGFTSKPSEVESSSIHKLIHSTSSPAVLTLDLPYPRRVIGVSDQAGISSAAFTHVIGRVISTSKGRSLDLNVYSIWNPLSSETHQMLFSDGLGTDNTGIHGLLRRRVTKIITMYSPLASIIQNPSTAESDIAGLFGVMTSDPSSMMGENEEEYNKSRQVFPSEDFERLISGLQTNYRQGKPSSYLLKTRALANPHVGVPGGHPVDLLILTSDAPDIWVNALPIDVRRKLPKVVPQESNTLPIDEEKEENFFDLIEDNFEKIGEKADEVREIFRALFHRSNLKDFPFPLTTSLDFSVELVNLLTNLMTWQVLESKELFDELLQG